MLYGVIAEKIHGDFLSAVRAKLKLVFMRSSVIENESVVAITPPAPILIFSPDTATTRRWR